MITINLLPHHLRPIKRTPLPYMISGLILVLVVLACAGIYVKNQKNIHDLRTEVATQKAALDKLQEVVKEYNSLTEAKELLGAKIQAISEIASDRIIWSEQLAKLAEFAPPNFWYDEIKVDVRTFNEPKEQIDPKTKEKKTIMVPVKRPVLIVDGYVIDDENGRRSVNPLTLVTTEDPEFSSIFKFLSPAIEDTVFDGYPVRQFSLEYLIKSGGNEQ